MKSVKKCDAIKVNLPHLRRMLHIINGSLESEITPEESEREEITHYIISADTKHRLVQFLCS